MNIRVISTLFLGAMLFVGAGCTSLTDESGDYTTKPAETRTENTEAETSGMAVPGNEGIEEKIVEMVFLKAEAKGPGTVAFTWDVAGEVAENAQAYRILRSIEGEPTWPAPYWFQRGPTYRDKTWTNLPSGKAQFRLCVVTNDTCETYSNTVEVDVE